MLRTTTLPVGTSGEESQFCVLRFTGNQGSYQVAMTSGATDANCFAIAANPANNLIAYGFIPSPPTEDSSVDGALSTAAEIVSIDGDTSGKRMRRSGVSQTLTNPTVLVRPDRGVGTMPNTFGGPFDSQTLGAGIFSDKFNSTMVGRIGLAAWVPYVVDAPTRNRIQHALAFSFKIPCS
jgi:hypothetical protein